MLKKIVLSALMVGACFGTAVAADPATALVEKVGNGEIKIMQTFPSVGNLQGFVVKPVKGGRQAVLYADKQGRYILAGNLMTPNGANQTQIDTKKYVLNKMAADAYQSITQQAWFTEGSDKAPHKAYIIVDPNCIFCHLIYKELAPLIAKGDLQVRWLPVGFLKPSSAGKSAAILMGKTDADKIQLLKKDEMEFDRAHEAGGIKALQEQPNNPAVTKAFADVKSNTSFAFEHGFNATPAILFVNATTNQPDFYPGFVKGEALTQLVQKMKGQW